MVFLDIVKRTLLVGLQVTLINLFFYSGVIEIDTRNFVLIGIYCLQKTVLDPLTIIGTTFGGLMYIRWGTFRSLLIFGIAQALTNLLYMWLALAGRKVWLLVLATSVDTMVGGMGQAAFVAFLMSLVLRITAPCSMRCSRRSLRRTGQGANSRGEA